MIIYVSPNPPARGEGVRGVTPPPNYQSDVQKLFTGDRLIHVHDLEAWGDLPFLCPALLRGIGITNEIQIIYNLNL